MLINHVLKYLQVHVYMELISRIFQRNELLWRYLKIIYLLWKSQKIPKGGNQLLIEGQTIQRPEGKGQKDKTLHRKQDWAIRTPQNPFYIGMATSMSRTSIIRKFKNMAAFFTVLLIQYYVSVGIALIFENKNTTCMAGTFR